MKKSIILMSFLLLFLTGCGEKDSYVCLNGYTLNPGNNKCYREVETEATPNYYCTDTDEVIDGSKCKKTALTQANITRACNPGYYAEGGLCVKSGTIINYEKCGVNKTYDSKKDECYDKVNTIILYNCSTGELDGTTCVNISYSDALLEYICPDNYTVSGTKCYRSIVMDAVKE